MIAARNSAANATPMPIAVIAFMSVRSFGATAAVRGGNLRNCEDNRPGGRDSVCIAVIARELDHRGQPAEGGVAHGGGGVERSVAVRTDARHSRTSSATSAGVSETTNLVPLASTITVSGFASTTWIRSGLT